ncbi:MAG TPA: hypothetical protein VEY95_09680 [Azospirillaceae bacterium]|nr:hypothetical protein [Azospirillaceae bacterium]
MTTIFELLTDDMQAVRECFAEAGNAPLEGITRTAHQVGRLARILDADRMAVEQALLPPLRRSGRLTPDIQAAYAAMAAVAEEARTLSEAPSGEPGWAARFVRLEQDFEAAARRVEADLIPAVREGLSSDEVAQASRAARAVRLGRPGG